MKTWGSRNISVTVIDISLRNKSKKSGSCIIFGIISETLLRLEIKLNHNEITLDHILDDKSIKSVFQAFCKSKYITESLNFLSNVQAYKSKPSEALFNIIKTKFIKEESDQEINIEGLLKSEIMNLKYNDNSEAFDSAANHIKGLLVSDGHINQFNAYLTEF